MNDRLFKLREKMNENGIDMYLITTSDFHGQEFISDYFKTREYISGFKGSAGTLVVTMDFAGLWTDGRYYIQAEKELKGSDITLFKDGMESVISYKDFIIKNLKDNYTLGFDGRCVMTLDVLNIKNLLETEGINIYLKTDKDLVGEIWDERKDISHTDAFLLEEKYSGCSATSKIEEVKEFLKENNGEFIIFSAPDEVCYLLNIRANDVKFSPVFLSYLVVKKDESILYCDINSALNIADYLDNIGIKVREYDKIYDDLKNINLSVEDKKYIICELSKVNYNLYLCFMKNRVKNMLSPASLMKAIKNETELNNLKQCHIKDAIAYIRFLRWFDENVYNKKDSDFSEIDIANVLLSKRSELEGFIEESFESIVAYGKNSAIVHYSPFENEETIVKDKSVLLIDTGGHYFEGTTDITRTLSCGEVSDEEKKDYTLVLKGHIALLNARFPKDLTDKKLDVFARAPLWKYGKDFKHGTGHGVGYLLNVHEGPNNISYYPGRRERRFYPGMVTSDEPGIYIKDSYGIRIENLMFCKESEMEGFLEFENLTMVPYDKRLIDFSLLDESEVSYINSFHNKIKNTLSPYLNDEDKVFLEKLI